MGRATSADDLAKAYRLVYQVYLNTSYIKPEHSGMRLRIFEASSDTATFIAKKDDEVVGVISVVRDSSDLGLPSDVAFREELNVLRHEGARLCEVTNQAVAEGYRHSAVTTELMRCVVAHSLYADCGIGVATVSPSHRGFYDLLGFWQVGGERSYSTDLYDPVVALSMDFSQYRRIAADALEAEQFVHAFLGKDNPYNNKVALWERAAKTQFFNPELLAELFVRQSDFLTRCSPAEAESVWHRWGQELFGAVVGAIPRLARVVEFIPECARHRRGRWNA